jgi:hypothetical protein
MEIAFRLMHPGHSTCCLPMFSPTISTIRLRQPIVPSPGAMSTTASA